jgi:hypothetical protein
MTGRMSGRVKIDPQLRGRVSGRTLDALRSRGCQVHRVGAAAYVHHDVYGRWIVGVWEDGAPAPAWAERLHAHHWWMLGRGAPTALQVRRTDAWMSARPRGLAWWQAADGTPQDGFRAPWRVVP